MHEQMHATKNPPTKEHAHSHAHTNLLGKTLCPKAMENKLVDTWKKHSPSPVRRGPENTQKKK